MDTSTTDAGAESGGAPDRLTVLVGAGASVQLGVPNTTDATRQLVEGEPGDDDRRLTREELRMLQQMLNVLGQWAPRSNPNFEHLLHCLEVVITMQHAWRAAGSGHLRNMFSLVTGGPRAELLPLFEGIIATNAVSYFFDRLHSIFSGHNPKQDLPAEWNHYQGFWGALAGTYRLDIATTNYDDLVEIALPELNQGFQSVPGESTKRFSPHVLRKPENRLVHLHGSIHWGYRSGATDGNRFAFQDSWHDLYWHDDPVAAQRSWGWRSNQTSQSGCLTNRSGLKFVTATKEWRKARPSTRGARTMACGSTSCPTTRIGGRAETDDAVYTLADSCTHPRTTSRTCCSSLGSLSNPHSDRRLQPTCLHRVVSGRSNCRSSFLAVTKGGVCPHQAHRFVPTPRPRQSEPAPSTGFGHRSRPPVPAPPATSSSGRRA
jgi:hypothetical protein